jgi:hypothetical protein
MEANETGQLWDARAAGPEIRLLILGSLALLMQEGLTESLTLSALNESDFRFLFGILHKSGMEALESFDKSISFLFAEDHKDNDSHLLNFKEDPKLVHSQTIEGSFIAFDLFYQFSFWKRIIFENSQV